MEHYLPRLAREVPILHSHLFVHLHLLLWLALYFFLLMGLLFLDFIDYLVAHEPASVDYVVEDGVTEELEVDSDLVSSACDRVALKQRRICLAIVPYFSEECFAVLQIIFLHFSFFPLFFCILFFFLYCKFLFFFQLFPSFDITFFLLDFLGDPIDPIFVRETLDVC
jgi:hypothetical protein